MDTVPLVKWISLSLQAWFHQHESSPLNQYNSDNTAGTLRPLSVQQADCLTFFTGEIDPSAVKAHKDLVAALEDMHTWEVRHRIAEDLLKEMLQSRSEAAELSKKYDTRWISENEDQRLVAPPCEASGCAVFVMQWVQQLLSQAVDPGLRNRQHCMIIQVETDRQCDPLEHTQSRAKPSPIFAALQTLPHRPLCPAWQCWSLQTECRGCCWHCRHV